MSYLNMFSDARLYFSFFLCYSIPECEDYIMGKSLFIAEKPSVAQEFAKALKINTKKHDGYLEGDTAVVT